MRYYFHVRIDDDLIRDDEGIELESDEHAREEAVRSAGELGREYPRDETGFAAESICVMDEMERELFVVPIHLH